ncbi:(2Fe-2S)-binding protein [Acinetobacter gyllenbergii]|uniref:(2Fe-2S)-binding protein n=1 Tax=Acinetobacter gyllenbergii TaxID=134534 RepID=UPI0021D10FB0|nr:(2Fe-2S)-binding protein [Acinetobacter gyllenbergii]MCU4582302.1 (2Fe-2S)-binding protein [Acinetobacter gyllenbergii]
MIQLFINGNILTVVDGMTVAAALAQAKSYSRLSVRGEQRTPFCGMGVCQECRVKINGLRVLACQTLCQQGMQVETQ